jgi:transposase
VQIRDPPIAGRRTFLVWRKRRFRCRGFGCTFTERHAQVPSRQRVTRRCHRGARGAQPAHRRALSAFAPRRGAPGGHGGLDRPDNAYRQALRQELPQAQIVCDPFHLVRGANEALDTVRRQRQHQPALRRRQQGRKRRTQGWRQQLFRARHRLLKAPEGLGFQERRSVCERFDAEPLLAEAWALKEAFRAVYRSTSRSEAEQRLGRFLAAVERAAIPSSTAFAEGIRLWARRTARLLRLVPLQ